MKAYISVCVIFSIYPFASCFLISNWETHGEKYLRKCKNLKIEPNPICLPQTDDNKSQNKPNQQTNLQDYVTPIPKWTKEGLLEHILEFVVQDDQVISFICSLYRIITKVLISSLL